MEVERMPGPADRIIKKCGGEKAVAMMLDMDVSSIHRWRYPRSRGGCEGRVPSAKMQPLMREAKKRGITIKPKEFFEDEPAEQAGTAA